MTPCTLVYKYHTVRRLVLEHRSRNIHRCENIEFHTDIVIFLENGNCWAVTDAAEERTVPMCRPGVLKMQAECPTSREKEVMQFASTFLIIA